MTEWLGTDGTEELRYGMLLDAFGQYFKRPES